MVIQSRKQYSFATQGPLEKEKLQLCHLLPPIVGSSTVVLPVAIQNRKQYISTTYVHLEEETVQLCHIFPSRVGNSTDVLPRAIYSRKQYSFATQGHLEQETAQMCYLYPFIVGNITAIQYMAIQSRKQYSCATYGQLRFPWAAWIKQTFPGQITMKFMKPNVSYPTHLFLCNFCYPNLPTTFLTFSPASSRLACYPFSPPCPPPHLLPYLPYSPLLPSSPLSALSDLSSPILPSSLPSALLFPPFLPTCTPNSQLQVHSLRSLLRLLYLSSKLADGTTFAVERTVRMEPQRKLCSDKTKQNDNHSTYDHIIIHI